MPPQEVLKIRLLRLGVILAVYQKTINISLTVVLG